MSSAAKPTGLTLRRASDDDWPDIIDADARAFAMRNPLPDEEVADLRGKVQDADVVVVRDTNRTPEPLAGVSMFYRMALTVPGGEVSDVAGLSWVSVASTHRRRGILRKMMTELFDQWENEGQTFAMLTASEGTIYERFGFGPAAFAQTVTLEPGRVKMRRKQPKISPVRFANGPQVAAAIPEIHTRWAHNRPGGIHRTEQWWRPILADRSSERPPVASGLHYLLHDDGYASYRVHKDMAHGAVSAHVEEFFAVTDDAHTELWRVLLGLDLVPTVHATIPVDDPLSAKLVDVRATTVTGINDKLWLRILDVPAALQMRRYRSDFSAVVEVVDDFRGAGGIFDVTVRDGLAEVTASTAQPTARLDVSVLGSIYLGGMSAARFAAAGRLWTDSDETLRAIDTAFSTTTAPFAGTFF